MSLGTKEQNASSHRYVVSSFVVIPAEDGTFSLFQPNGPRKLIGNFSGPNLLDYLTVHYRSTLDENNRLQQQREAKATQSTNLLDDLGI